MLFRSPEKFLPLHSSADPIQELPPVNLRGRQPNRGIESLAISPDGSRLVWAGEERILVVADRDNDPAWIAADMLAQAEHDTDASAVLLTTSKQLAIAVQSEVERQLKTLPTAPTARKAIDKNSAIILVRSLDEAVEISNRFAPEHLSIPDASLVKGIRHAGSIFIGPYSPEAAGDYASGPNHVLPTSGAARLRGGLSALDYVKIISTQELTASALAKLEPAITTLARAEGLEAHARSVEVRRGKQ